MYCFLMAQVLFHNAQCFMEHEKCTNVPFSRLDCIFHMEVEENETIFHFVWNITFLALFF